MLSLKRVQLTLLALIAATILPASPASAAGRVVKLTPSVGSDEPNALGQAKFSEITFVGWVLTWGGNVPAYTADVSVTCKGLTPGATYYWRTSRNDPSASSPASATGTWNAQGSVLFWANCSAVVYRVDVLPDGTLQETPVLFGSIPYR